jgi:hypothetical protein
MLNVNSIRDQTMSSQQYSLLHVFANIFLSIVLIAAVIRNFSSTYQVVQVAQTFSPLRNPTERRDMKWGQEREEATSSVAPAPPNPTAW